MYLCLGADTNEKDGVLTEHEFISLPDADYEAEAADTNYQLKRSAEFKNVIDTNHDGVATKDELVVSACINATAFTG